MASTGLYFELETYDRYHRADWEDRLAGWFSDHPATLHRASRAADAEFIIEPQSWHSFLGGHVFKVAPASHYSKRPDSTFAWDTGDFPTGRLPGVYCSLSRRLSNPSRHRSFCYPLRINRLLQEFPLADARYLFGFSGNITAPLRARIFTKLRLAADSGLGRLRQTESLFTRIYDPSADRARGEFADDMRQSRFILCPRGNGLSSIRLFETMEAARVPVIISDALALPQCVNWDACAVVVREDEIDRIPDILSSRADDWPLLAANARREWERCFGNATLIPNLVEQLRSIVAARTRSEKSQRYYFPFHVLPDFTMTCAKALVRRLQLLRRGLKR